MRLRSEARNPRAPVIATVNTTPCVSNPFCSVVALAGGTDTAGRVHDCSDADRQVRMVLEAPVGVGTRGDEVRGSVVRREGGPAAEPEPAVQATASAQADVSYQHCGGLTGGGGGAGW